MVVIYKADIKKFADAFRTLGTLGTLAGSWYLFIKYKRSTWEKVSKVPKVPGVDFVNKKINLSKSSINSQKNQFEQ